MLTEHMPLLLLKTIIVIILRKFSMLTVFLLLVVLVGNSIYSYLHCVNNGKAHI